MPSFSRSLGSIPRMTSLRDLSVMLELLDVEIQDSTYLVPVTIDTSCMYTCSWSVTQQLFPFDSYHGRTILSGCTSLTIDFFCRPCIFVVVSFNYFRLGPSKEPLPEQMWLRVVEWPGYLEPVLMHTPFNQEACFQNLVPQ